MLWIILAVILIIILYNCLFRIKLKLQTINFYSGGLGSGKTLQATKTAIKLRNRSILGYYLIGKHPINFTVSLFITLTFIIFGFLKVNFASLFLFGINILILICLIKKREILKRNYQIRRIYSNYPIMIKITKKKIYYSTPLTRNHLLGIDKVDEHSIIVLDEAQIMFPNQKNRSDPTVIWNLTFARHFHNSTIIMCSQSIGNMDVALRRVVNVVYNFSSFRRLLFFFYKVDVDKINYMEDVIQNVNNVQEENHMFYFGMFGKRRYNSRYMKEYYNPTNKDTNYEFKDYKLNPLDNYFNLETYKKCFYNN